MSSHDNDRDEMSTPLIPSVSNSLNRFRCGWTTVQVVWTKISDSISETRVRGTECVVDSHISTLQQIDQSLESPSRPRVSGKSDHPSILHPLTSRSWCRLTPNLLWGVGVPLTSFWSRRSTLGVISSFWGGRQVQRWRPKVHLVPDQVPWERLGGTPNVSV